MRNDLGIRTKKFASEIVKMVQNLDNNQVAWVLGKQILRSGTSVAANYRAACRARSRAEFISKMGIVEEESDETSYWLSMMLEAKLFDETKIRNLMAEANQITAMVVSSIKTARKNGRVKVRR
ncbi:MAG: four helix bundle protein [Candidatus Margulisiibacteriota bacterium]